MSKKIYLTCAIVGLALSIPLGTEASEMYLNLNSPKASQSAIELNINNTKTNDALIKLITLDGVASNESTTEIQLNKNSFAKYFISGDDKFAQSNITSAYSDYTKATVAATNNDFQALLLAYKLANIGFFTLSQQAINQITDTDLYSLQTQSIKDIFSPFYTLTYDEEILLAELYADIYYNNLSLETTKELSKNSNLLKKSDYANYILSQAYYEAGEYGKAMSAINKSLAIKKHSPLYLQHKAKILCGQKNYGEAIKILEKIDEASFLIGKFRNGIDVQIEYTQSNAHKDVAKSKYHLANYFYLIGESNRAIKEVGNSIAVKKNNVEAYTLLGDIQASVGEYEKARDAYSKALNTNKKYAKALYGMGNVEKNTGTYETALGYYRLAQKYDKHNLNIMLAIAELLYKTGAPLEAKEICASAILRHPNSSQLYYVMSEIYPERQLEYLRVSLSLNAFNRNAWIDMAEVNATQNNIELAEKYLLAVRATETENYKYYYVEGLINKYKSNPVAAAASFQKALKLNPNYSPAAKELNTLDL